MPPSGFAASDMPSAPASLEAKGTEGDYLQRRRRAGVPMQTAALRAGLVVCLGLLAVATLGARWRCNGNFASLGGNGSAHTRLMHAITFNTSKMITPHLSTDAFCRGREVQYGKIGLESLRRLYAQVQRRGHHHKRRWRRHRAPYPFLQHRYWTALSLDGEAGIVDLSRLASDNVNAGLVEWTSSIFPDSSTSSSSIQGGGWGDSPVPKVATGALTLSGGSIANTNKVSVDAGGMLQVVSAPAWSFNAQLDGQFAPDTTKASAGGTFKLFSSPNWSFIASLNGEFSPQPQLYAGSGTLQYTW
jgi:hypothetical protein